MIFSSLCVVALYETRTWLLSVMLPVAFAVIGGALAVLLRAMLLSIYGQIDLVLLIGFAAKNAILIVEFAREEVERAKLSVIQAADDAARARYRPVMMTAPVFIIGVIPPVIATAAGAGSRQSTGTTVFGGMVSASCSCPCYLLTSRC